MTKGTKLPFERVKLQISAELLCAVIGLAPFWACLFAFLMPQLFLYGNEMQAGHQYPAFPFMVATAFAVVSFIAHHLCDRFREPRAYMPVLCVSLVTIACLVVVGILGVGAVDAGSPFGWLAYVIWPLAGAGLCCLFLLWTTLFTHFEKSFFSLGLCASALVGAAIAGCMLFVTVDTRPWFLAFLYVLSLIILNVLRKDIEPVHEFPSRKASMERHTLDIPVDILNALYNVVFGVILAIVQETGVARADTTVATIIIAGTIALGTAITVPFLGTHTKMMVHGPVQRVLFPVLMIGLLPFPFVSGILSVVCTGVLLAAAIVYMIVVTDSLIALSRHFDASPWYLVPRGMVPTMVGLAVGSLLGYALLQTNGYSTDLLTYGSLILALVLVISFTFLPLDEDHLKPIEEDDGASYANFKSPNDLFQLRCDAIAQEHGLSARESQVFSLVARGRTSAYIQDQLCISQHTVKTHRNNIYRKLDVATRDELITLVESQLNEDAYVRELVIRKQSGEDGKPHEDSED